ncbi:MAG: hypothetical protein ACYCVZ_06340, partial [Streptosporangiaceae bacterium]
MQRTLTTPSRTAAGCRWPRSVPAVTDRHDSPAPAAVPADHDQPGGSPWPVQAVPRRDRPARWLGVAMA